MKDSCISEKKYNLQYLEKLQIDQI